MNPVVPVVPGGKPSRRVALVVWGAMLVSCVVIAGVAVAVAAPTLDPGAASLLVLVGTVLALANVVLAFTLPQRLVRPGAFRGAPPEGDTLAFGRVVVGAALCEGAALFSAVVFIVTGDVRAAAPFALAFGALLAQVPGEGRWRRLAGTAPQAAPNRMMRG